MKNLISAIAVLMFFSTTLTGCSDESPKKEESVIKDDRPELYKGFKPTDRSKSKGF